VSVGSCSLVLITADTAGGSVSGLLFNRRLKIKVVVLAERERAKQAFFIK
jgi:hypothetical protein